MRSLARCLAWCVIVIGGVLLWMLGLVVLDVPAGLSFWRHLAGGAILLAGVALLRLAFKESDRG